MAGEAMAMLKVASWVIPSMAYARFASSVTRPGSLRLLTLVPVIIPLLFLPLYFSTLHLRAISAFFLVWLLPFKLLLLSFGLGPLHVTSSLPFPTFLAISALPVKLRSDKSPPNYSSCRRVLLPCAIKALLLFSVVSLYRYKSQIHPHLLTAVYCVHLYLALDLVLASAALLVGVLTGLEVEPQFDAPFRSDSLQDFWGRRWNLTVTGILRPSVYRPISSRWGPVAGFLATFAVSGMMHEVMLSYMTLARPAVGEMSCFFMLHGICTVAEVSLKRKGWWRPHPTVGRPLTLGFVAMTGLWLFFAPIVRSGVDRIVVEESQAMVSFVEFANVRTAIGRLFR